jgi:hypothetical protein
MYPPLSYLSLFFSEDVFTFLSSVFTFLSSLVSSPMRTDPLRRAGDKAWRNSWRITRVEVRNIYAMTDTPCSNGV